MLRASSSAASKDFFKNMRIFSLCAIVFFIVFLFDVVESSKMGVAWKGLLDRLSNKQPRDGIPSFSSKNMVTKRQFSLFKLNGGHTVAGGAGAGAAAAAVAQTGPAGMPLFAVKMILQLALTSINMISWAIPLRNKNFTKDSKLLGLANCFAGGIFLMLAFGHMLPHSIEVLGSIGADRNLAFKFALLGYLVVFFIEKMAFDAHSIMHEVMDDSHSHSHDHAHSASTSSSSNIVAEFDSNSKSTTIPNAVTLDHSHGHVEHFDTVADSSAGSSSSGGSLSPKSAIVLLAAMSVHSLFETMALGLANDWTSAVMMAASIGLHQPAESIALLVAFLKTSMPRPQVMRWLALFSMVGPLGVTAGVLISKIATPLMDAIIVALTAGTFLYVGATEVVNEEFENAKGAEKWKKFGALLCGMGMILAVTMATEGWEGGSCAAHGHGHTHTH